MNIAIVDYRSGNLHSALKSFQAAASNFKNVNVKITSCYKDVRVADKVVLPGVGSFSFCKSKLHENIDVYKSLIDIVIEKKKPFLGICVGMQLLATTGHEGQSNNPGLNWIRGEVKKIDVEQNLKIPHMGWNNLSFKNYHPIFNGINTNDHFYFVHSYEFIACSEKDIVATTNHGKNIVAAIAKENIICLLYTSPSPRDPGLKIISNFIEWDPLR